MSAGYRSPSGVWVGGVSSPSTVAPGGYTSLLGFWVGGVSAEAYTPPTPTSRPWTVRKRVSTPKNIHRLRLLREDEELIVL